MTDRQEICWPPKPADLFRLDADKPRGPQIVSMIWQLGTIFGGPLLLLFGADRYPFLIPDRTLYMIGLAGIAALFLASFALFQDDDFPTGMPQRLKLLFRAGWGLCTTGLLLGIALVFNGYDTPLLARDAAVISKRETLYRDPSRRTYYVAVRAWPNSRAVVELAAPRQTYQRLLVPVVTTETPQPMLEAMADAAHVRLILGEGRLGLEWLKGIEVP